MGIDNIDLNAVSEPEVVKAVIEEIKTFGDNFKKNYAELRKNHEELKDTVDAMSKDKDILLEEKYQKLSQDIITRQEDLDDKFAKGATEANKRIDSIEIALQRLPLGGGDSKEIVEEARKFHILREANRRKSDAGISFEEAEKFEPNIDDYRKFCKAFELYVRKYGGSRDVIMDQEQIKALQVGIDPDGGVTVPVAMLNRITQAVYESDPIRQLAMVESITTGSLEWMVETDEAGSGWEGETYGETTIGGETATPGWQKRKITVHTQYARARATQILLEDSGINIEQWLSNKIAQKLYRDEAAAFVTGSGVGKPRGFLTYDNGTSWGQIEQIAMGAAAALTCDGFIDVKYSLKEDYLARVSAWLMNRTTVAAAMKLKDGNGDYIWKPSLIANDPNSAILNIPVRMSTTMPEVAANALSVALADWREAYMIVDRLGITVQRDPYTVKPFIEFYTRKRVGGDVSNFEAIKIGKISA